MFNTLRRRFLFEPQWFENFRNIPFILNDDAAFWVGPFGWSKQ